MKKMRFLFVAVMAGLMCIACTPKKEKLLRSYEDACQRGDATAVLRVVSEMEKEFGDKDEHEVFTETELARFEAASAIFEQKMAEQAMQQLKKHHLNQLAQLPLLQFMNITGKRLLMVLQKLALPKLTSTNAKAMNTTLYVGLLRI